MGFEFQAQQGAAVEILLNHMQRHIAPPEPRAQEGVLGAEVGEAPDAQRRRA